MGAAAVAPLFVFLAAVLVLLWWWLKGQLYAPIRDAAITHPASWS